jgi:ATP/maltotriose-dependent transcriptional regulator MalT
LQENLSAAQATFEENFAWARERGLGHSPLLVYLHLGLAILSLVDDNLENAREHIQTTQEYSRYINETSALYRSSILLFLLEKTTTDNAAIDAAWGSLKKTATALENPDITEQLRFLETLLVEKNSSAKQLQVTRYLAACTSLKYAHSLILPKQPQLNSLSEREIEILIFIANGLKNKEIAEEMIISLNTVLYHTKNIYNKLGVNKRTQAVLKAKELGLI